MYLIFTTFCKKIAIKVWLKGFNNGRSVLKPLLYLILFYPLFYFIYSIDGVIGQCTKQESQLLVFSYYIPFHNGIEFFENVRNICFPDNFSIFHIFLSSAQSALSFTLILLIIFAGLFPFFFVKKKKTLQVKNIVEDNSKKTLDIDFKKQYQFDLREATVEFVATTKQEAKKELKQEQKIIEKKEQPKSLAPIIQPKPKKQIKKVKKEYWDIKTLSIKNQIEGYLKSYYHFPKFQFSKKYPFLRSSDKGLEQDVYKQNKEKIQSQDEFFMNLEKQKYQDRKLEAEIFSMGVKEKKNQAIADSIFSVDSKEEKNQAIADSIFSIDSKKEEKASPTKKVADDVFSIDSKKEEKASPTKKVADDVFSIDSKKEEKASPTKKVANDVFSIDSKKEEKASPVGEVSDDVFSIDSKELVNDVFSIDSKKDKKASPVEEVTDDVFITDIKNRQKKQKNQRGNFSKKPTRQF